MATFGKSQLSVDRFTSSAIGQENLGLSTTAAGNAHNAIDIFINNYALCFIATVGD